jgi:hypothetical protein
LIIDRFCDHAVFTGDAELHQPNLSARLISRLSRGLLCLSFVTAIEAAKDIDFFIGSGNVSAQTEYSMKFADDGITNKIRTNFSPYDSVINLGIRWLATYLGPRGGPQFGVELSYFGGSSQLPADRIVEISNSGRVTSISSQGMSASDRIRFDTGRGSFYCGAVVAVIPSKLTLEVGGLAGLGLGRVNDSPTLLSNGRTFSSYTSGSIHLGFNFRLRVFITTDVSLGAEYRYLAEEGISLVSPSDELRRATNSVNSNLFSASVGYRYNHQ